MAILGNNSVLNTTANSNDWNFNPLSLFQRMENSSNQVFKKDSDGSIKGVRYVIMSEPARSKPIRAWTINIEQWVCSEQENIVAKDIISLKTLNHPRYCDVDTTNMIDAIWIKDKEINLNDKNAFNALMATILFISKIDASTMPNIEKILALHGLN